MIESLTLAVHGEVRSAVANGLGFGDLTLYAIAEDEEDELQIIESVYAKHGTIAPNVPWFLALLDAFAQRIDLGASNVPTFADGITVQRQLEAIGYGRPG